MKNILYAFMLLTVSASLFASECSLGSGWRVLDVDSSVPEDTIQVDDIIELHPHSTAQSPNQHQVFRNGPETNMYLCNSESVVSSGYTISGDESGYVYPKINCTFTHQNELMLFTAVMVKNGDKDQDRCDHYFYQRSLTGLSDEENIRPLDSSCSTQYKCLIHWSINSLDQPGRSISGQFGSSTVVTREGSGQGTGGNDGGGTG